MNSYKCAQCGLTNWKTSEFCKRCGIQNPYLNQSFQPNNFQAAVVQNNISAQPQFSPQVPVMPDYASPPPPNVFGSSAGAASMNEINRQYSPDFRTDRPPIRDFNQANYSPVNAEELKTAEKHIRNAWVCGIVVCSMTALIVVIMAATASSLNIIAASPGEMFFSLVLFAGLTTGVYFKSRVCAVLLCGLFILDKILTFAQTGKMSGAIMAFVFIYYFAYGIQGTFTYHKLTKQK